MQQQMEQIQAQLAPAPSRALVAEGPSRSSPNATEPWLRQNKSQAINPADAQLLEDMIVLASIRPSNRLNKYPAPKWAKPPRDSASRSDVTAHRRCPPHCLVDGSPGRLPGIGRVPRAPGHCISSKAIPTPSTSGQTLVEARERNPYLLRVRWP